MPGIQKIKEKYIKKKSNMALETPTETSQMNLNNTGAKPKDSSGSVTSRHPAGKTEITYEHDEIGFLSSWNFMISKRWKNISNTGATGDIAFMDKLLSDFRKFCNNEDERLVNYCEECCQQIHTIRTE